MNWLVRRRSASLILMAASLGGIAPAPIASAAPATGATARAESGTPALSGVLAIEGAVTLNGAPARSGATVFSGSTISTASNGKARIDVVGVGLVDLGPSTVVSITIRAGEVVITLPSAGTVRPSVRSGARARVVVSDATHSVEVVRGAVDVASAGVTKTIAVGQTVNVAAKTEIAAKGDSLFVVADAATTAKPAAKVSGVDVAAAGGIGAGAIVALTASAVGAAVTVANMGHGSDTEPAAREVSPASF